MTPAPNVAMSARTIRLSSSSRQRGALLVITMIMLMLLSLVSVSMVRSSTMDERMAGSARDRNKAFQAAEFALRHCLARLLNGTYAGTSPTALTPTSPPTSPHWETATNWATSSANSAAVSMGSGAGLAADPRCMYEYLGASTAGSYRVTARAVGGSDTTAVILQATFSNE